MEEKKAVRMRCWTSLDGRVSGRVGGWVGGLVGGWIYLSVCRRREGVFLLGLERGEGARFDKGVAFGCFFVWVGGWVGGWVQRVGGWVGGWMNGWEGKKRALPKDGR